MRIDAIDIEVPILDKIESKHGVTFEECEEAALSPHRRIRPRDARALQGVRPDGQWQIPAGHSCRGRRSRHMVGRHGARHDGIGAEEL